MGKQRNEGKVERTEWWDRRVCKPYLLGCCLPCLLATTKYDLGPCKADLCGNERLRLDFEADRSEKKARLEVKWMRELLPGLRARVEEADITVRRNKEKLAALQGTWTNPDEAPEMRALVQSMSETANEAELAGEEGAIEKAQRLLTKLEELKAQQAVLRAKLQQPSNHTAMRVCDVTGSIFKEADVDNYYLGKQYLGYATLRQKLKDFEKRVAEAGPEGDDGKDREERPKERVRDREREPPRDRDREREHGKDKGHDRGGSSKASASASRSHGADRYQPYDRRDRGERERQPYDRRY
eukprot:TRINITY_DN15913_c0_g1_i1.p2 TRINITY_DN15913_c0_g1~~TRINITY_DN15913_c0_g1_i1.p2  ORF type:complete len:316 (-),score=129.41 TRINITY_DN15913_c0_g1_i1:17-910(-)